MIVQFPGNSYTRGLQGACKNMEVSDEQFDRMLQSVLTAVGKPQSANYTEAVQMVDKMAAANMTRVVNSVIATGTGAAVMAAALFLVVSVNTKPAMEPAITIEDGQVPLTSAPDFDQDSPYAVDSAGVPSDDLPVLDSFQVDEQYIYIYFQNIQDEAGWRAIYGVDAAGNRVDPVHIDPDQGVVVFALPQDRLEIFCEDTQGNHARVAVQPD